MFGEISWRERGEIQDSLSQTLYPKRGNGIFLLKNCDMEFIKK